MNTGERLKSVRRMLFKEIDEINSPLSLYEIQYKIATEIINSENNSNNTFQEEYEEHITFLRYYADTLAWLLLYPHTIQQLYNKTKLPQSLTDRGKDFLDILSQAKKYAQNGSLVLITDITNCINTNNIIICDDPSKPMLIGCKQLENPSQQKSVNYKPYKQERDALSMFKYLDKLKKKSFGKKYNSKNDLIKHSWDIVNETVKEAIKCDVGVGIVDGSDVMWAFRYKDSMPEVPIEILNKIKNYKLTVVGCHLRALEETELLINPPSCWPIDFECRFALMEGDIVIMHYIDSYRFKEIKNPYGVIEDVLFDGGTLKENCFVVKSNIEKKEVSCKFLNQVVYGYSTIDSMANLIIEYINK